MRLEKLRKSTAISSMCDTNEYSENNYSQLVLPGRKDSGYKGLSSLKPLEHKLEEPPVGLKSVLTSR